MGKQFIQGKVISFFQILLIQENTLNRYLTLSKRAISIVLEHFNSNLTVSKASKIIRVEFVHTENAFNNYLTVSKRVIIIRVL